MLLITPACTPVDSCHCNGNAKSKLKAISISKQSSGGDSIGVCDMVIGEGLRSTVTSCYARRDCTRSDAKLRGSLIGLFLIRRGYAAI